jgi:hypothetical protein
LFKICLKKKNSCFLTSNSRHSNVLLQKIKFPLLWTSFTSVFKSTALQRHLKTGVSMFRSSDWRVHNILLNPSHTQLCNHVVLLYPARSRWETYHGYCSRRDGAQTSVKTGSRAGRTHSWAGRTHSWVGRTHSWAGRTRSWAGRTHSQ